MIDNNKNTRIAKNSMFLSIRMIIVLAISLYTTRVLLKTIGVVDYGVYNVVCGIVNLFAFLNTSMSNGIQRFLNYELGKNDEMSANKVYNSALRIQLLLAIIILILIETVGLWYLKNFMVIPHERIYAAQWIFQFSSITFVLAILQAPYTGAVMAHEKMGFFAFMSVFDAIVKLGSILLIPYLVGDQLILYSFLLMLISVFNIFCYYIYCKRFFLEIYFSLSFDRRVLKNMLSFSGWNLFGSFSTIMKEQGINLIINLFFGPIVNAARGVAVQVNSGLMSFISNLTIPVRPQVIQSYAKGEIDRTMNLTYSISKFSSLLLYVLALPICYEIEFILELWLGKDVPEHTELFVVIIILTSFLNNLNSALSTVVHASGKMKRYQVSTSLLALTCIPLAYILLYCGAAVEWALWAVFLTMFFAQILSLFILKTIVPFSVLMYIRRVIFPFSVVVILSVWIPSVFVQIIPMGWLRLCVVSLVSFFTIILFSYIILEPSEKELLKNFSLIKSK